MDAFIEENFEDHVRLGGGVPEGCREWIGPTEQRERMCEACSRKERAVIPVAGGHQSVICSSGL